MAYRDIPLYTQLTNTCGLSSLLMIAKPEGTSLSHLLEDIATRIRVESYFEGPIAWQNAEAYLLMKSCFNRSLAYYLRKEFGDEYAYFKMILLQQLEDRLNQFLVLKDHQKVRDLRLFLQRGIIRKNAFYEYLFEMKTNLELKMLAYFYGGHQILFPSPDGTGCLFLDGKDTKDKLTTLYQHVPDGIIIGLGYHWLAVKGMEPVKKHQYNFIIHDPNGERRLVSSENIEKNFRFYAFHFDTNKQVQMDQIVRRALKLPKRASSNHLNKPKNTKLSGAL
ncbi:MAG: hypothetical protein EU536_02510 [Promethearchaeota archaeon]|nr:MAG: hypothetical protein EU536_02510 [Candidatus Lokiarchaeota archaeon]